jgi:release factor glutamine methyltransferase
MILRQAFRLLVDCLESIYETGEAESIAFIILEKYTGTGRNEFKWKAGETISPIQQQQIESKIPLLVQHRPVQYIVGEAWFRNMKFYVDENVLIPRPETEELVNWIIETYRDRIKPLQILEVGTGSGCIAISLKKELAAANLLAVDVSEAALTVAKKNADAINAEVKFSMADFLNEETWDQYPQVDIIVSNPPYIPINEIEMLDANVAEWEPATALFVPDTDPLLFYRKIAFFGKSHLQKDGEIFVECHQEFAVATKKMFEEYGYSAELKKDIFDNERMLLASLHK